MWWQNKALRETMKCSFILKICIFQKINGSYFYFGMERCHPKIMLLKIRILEHIFKHGSSFFVS
jgi:hypothetical protein